MEAQKRWQDWVNLILGLWLFISPFILDYLGISSAMAWNAYVMGVLVAAAAGMALARPLPWPEWANVLFGLWLIASPWILNYAGIAPAAAWNSWIVGVVVAVLAAWSLSQGHPPPAPSTER